MTHEQEAQYVSNGGIHCPHCGAIVEALDLPSMEGPEVIQEVRCTGCKREWRDVYVLRYTLPMPEHPRSSASISG